MSARPASLVRRATGVAVVAVLTVGLAACVPEFPTGSPSGTPSQSPSGTPTTSPSPAPSSSARPVFDIAEHQCAQTITVDGEPEFPMFLFQEEITAADGAAMEAAGVKFYSFIDKGVFLDLGWTGPQQQDFSDLDRVMATFTSRVDEGYALPRLHLWAPDWWLDAHPAEATGYLRTPPPVSFDFREDASFASELWLADAGDRLRAAVRHLLDGPDGDSLMGFTLAAGMYGEWHTWGANAIPDTSEPMRAYFEEYAREKYPTETALRAAWGDSAATFAGIVVPDEADRLATADGYFLDPTAGQMVVDYYEAYHQSVVEAISWFTSIVKDESDDALLTSVLYGYHPDLGWENQVVHHRAASQMHRLETVDMVTSPHSYVRRDLGQHASLRNFPEAVGAHGKLFVSEADERTHLANPSLFTLASTMEESTSVMRRAFGQAVTHGTGLWYMDHSSGQWYDDPAFAGVWSELKQWGDYSMTIPRCRNSEIAVISDLDGEFRLGTETDTTAKFYEGRIENSSQGMAELASLGTAFDRYLIEDLVDGKVPDDYRVYIFPDAIDLDADERAAVEALKRDGNTLVWNWAPGYVDDQELSLSSMESLTGFDIEKWSPSATLPVSTDFESGAYAGSGFDAGAFGFGALTSDPALVVDGTWSALGAAPVGEEWFEFLGTNPSETVLEGGARYRVEFDAQTNADPGNYFYFYAQSPSNGHAKDVGNFEWSGGDDGRKSVEFTLAWEDDYRVNWGVRGGGSVSIDGITITKINDAGMAPVSYTLSPATFPASPEEYGGEISLDPVFVPMDSDHVLATGTIGGNGPSLTVAGAKDHGTWTSVFLAAPPAPAKLLRWIAQNAGVHLYTSGGDPFEVSEKWISIHAATSGLKTITLPAASPVYDIFEDALVSTSTTSFSVQMDAGETRIFVLEDASAGAHE
ncbi:hypothetical protein ASD65_11200 [Microbacterium sp. Root61]|uniref:hypothetical protein n=1 Tax=Microbacterium sp. Root61 TaxID=1736570 RepID=UPI0006F73BCB|nr:hypothetical protein [Microbacterium sp. Root61]KRA24933.1 hypothetical protein ASD65_11200 [Microbacterium sp. Root61]